MHEITLTIKKEHDTFVVDDLAVPGSPVVGRGATVKEAVGDWLYQNQKQMGITFDVSSIQTEINIMQADALSER